MIKRHSRPNVVWHHFNLRDWCTPKIWLDFGVCHHKRKQLPKWNYDVKEYWIQLGSSLIHKDVFEIRIVSNQVQWLKYMHSEWSMTRELIGGMLFR